MHSVKLPVGGALSPLLKTLQVRDEVRAELEADVCAVVGEGMVAEAAGHGVTAPGGHEGCACVREVDGRY